MLASKQTGNMNVFRFVRMLLKERRSSLKMLLIRKGINIFINMFINIFIYIFNKYIYSMHLGANIWRSLDGNWTLAHIRVRTACWCLIGFNFGLCLDGIWESKHLRKGQEEEGLWALPSDVERCCPVVLLKTMILTGL